jgi:hypothetical protein
MFGSGQLFYDFNALQTTVPSAMVMSLDQSGVYIQLANRLARALRSEKQGPIRSAR